MSVRSLGLLVVLISSIVRPAVAGADDLEDAKKLATEATALARSGDFADAIAKFKAADALAPSAANDCNIALAYVKLASGEKLATNAAWHRADLFLQRCKRRWVRDKTTPLPGWVGTGHENVIAELKTGNFAAVSVTATPPAATIKGSAYGLGETLSAPVTLWLPFGDRSLTASSTGYTDLEKSISVEDRISKIVVLTLIKTGTETGGSNEPVTGGTVGDTPHNRQDGDGATGSLEAAKESPNVDEGSSNRRGRYVIGGGVAAFAVGAVFHALALGKKGDAEELGEGPAFDDASSTFSTYRAATIGFYAIGAAAVGVGAFLLWRDSSSASGNSGMAVGIAPSRGGAHASARWRF